MPRRSTLAASSQPFCLTVNRACISLPSCPEKSGFLEVSIRSDQGPEFIAEAVKAWITGVGARTAYIEKASPWENGYVESFNGKLRDELLNGEVFNTLKEAQVLIEEWR